MATAPDQSSYWFPGAAHRFGQVDWSLDPQLYTMPSLARGHKLGWNAPTYGADRSLGSPALYNTHPLGVSTN